jgi:hypothetical protein
LLDDVEVWICYGELDDDDAKRNIKGEIAVGSARVFRVVWTNDCKHRDG